MGTYAKATSEALKKMMKHPVPAVLSHWLFQSLFYMDATEKWFKIGLDASITMLVGLIFSLRFHSLVPWLVAFLFAHTVNFLFNGHLWGVLKHYGVIQIDRADFEKYVMSFQKRAQAQNSIEKILVFGSLARGQWKNNSDFDARIIRKSGLKNGIDACLFLVCERSRAFIHEFPVDIYILDGCLSSHFMNLTEQGKDLLAADWNFDHQGSTKS